MSTELLKDGSRAFLVDVADRGSVELALSKHGIDLISIDEALFDRSGKAVLLDFVVRGNDSDIGFALDDITKFIRPYPPSYVRARK